jgi:hypothetical protein
VTFSIWERTDACGVGFVGAALALSSNAVDNPRKVKRNISVNSFAFLNVSSSSDADSDVYSIGLAT